MTSSIEDYPYDESGLRNVVIERIEVRRCAKCNEAQPVIPNIEGLHRTLARSLIESDSRLAGEEVRFLRSYLGFSGTDFARVMGVKKETVSRWENNHEPIGGTADRALRLLVQSEKPVTDYAPEALNGLLERISDEIRARSRRLERRPHVGWSMAATT